MKASRIKAVLENILKTRWPAFIWGPPGVGKSSIVREIAIARRCELLDIRASLLDPTDLRGIPAIDNGEARWCPPSFLPRNNTTGILFFDELNAAPPLVQASLYQLTLDRSVGEYHLPEAWKIVAAGNRAEDASVTFRMPSALANRFVHLDFEVDFDDWRIWAVRNGIHPLVMGFLHTRKELLFNMEDPERGFPTPRSWEMVSDVLTGMGGPVDARDVVLGIIGESASIEFMAYCEDAISEERINEIIVDPERSTLPEKLSDQYALISYLTGKAQDKETRRVAGLLLNRLKPELSVLLLRNILQLQPQFLLETRVQEFVAKHKELVI